MSAVRSRGNRTTETKMVRLLREQKTNGWRRHCKIARTPDFCWLDKKVSLFVDGCFWHGCPRCYQTPKSNVAYWKEKVVANRKRDRRVTAALRAEGWTFVRVWECQIGEKRTLPRILKAVEDKRMLGGEARKKHTSRKQLR